MDLRILSLLVILASCSFHSAAGRDVFLPRYTASPDDPNRLYEPYDDTESKVEGINNEHHSSIWSVFGSGWIAELFKKMFRDHSDPTMSARPWYEKENVCRTKSINLTKIEKLHGGTTLQFGASTSGQVISQGYRYRSSSMNNGTHIQTDIEISECCPNSSFDEVRDACVKVDVHDFMDLLRSHNATQFVKYFEDNPHPIDATLFAYSAADGDSTLTESAVRSLTTIGKLQVSFTRHLDEAVFSEEPKGVLFLTSAVLKAEKDGERKIQPLVNCKRIESANNVAANNTLVHFASGAIPVSNQTVLEFIRANPNLSKVAEGLEKMRCEGMDIEEIERTHDTTKLTAFIPTDKALEGYEDYVKEALNDPERLCVVMYSLIVPEAVCVDPSFESPLDSMYTKKEDGHEHVELSGCGRVSETERNLMTRNGPVHMIDRIMCIPQWLMPIESHLRSVPKYAALSKMLGQLNASDELEYNSELVLLLPPEDRVDEIADEDSLKRHLLQRQAPAALWHLEPLYSDQRDDVQIQRMFAVSSGYANCVPLYRQNEKRFYDGYVLRVPRPIPKPFESFAEALNSTGRHKLLARLLEAVDVLKSDSVLTVLAVEDEGLKKAQGFEDVFELTDDGVIVLDESRKPALRLLRQLVSLGSQCVDAERLGKFPRADWTVKPLSGGKYHFARITEDAKDDSGLTLGNAQVSQANIFTKQGVIHSLDKMPVPTDPAGVFEEF